MYNYHKRSRKEVYADIINGCRRCFIRLTPLSLKSRTESARLKIMLDKLLEDRLVMKLQGKFYTSTLDGNRYADEVNRV